MGRIWSFDESDEIQQKGHLRRNNRLKDELKKQLKAES